MGRSKNYANRGLIKPTLVLDDKALYGTYEEAQAVALYEKFTGGKRLRPYQCKECGGWHLTTIKPF